MIPLSAKLVWRNLIKNPLYSFINIAGLGLGLAICILITLFVKDELSFDQFFKNKNNIYRIVTEEKSPNGEVFKFGQTGLVHGPSFKQQIPALKNMVRIKSETVIVKKAEDVVIQPIFLVDSTFFSLFERKFVDGSPHKVLHDPQTVVISESTSKKYFGTSTSVGRLVNMNFEGSFQNFIVSGVYQDWPINSSIQADILMPMHKSKSTDDQWINFYINTFVEIPEGTNLQYVEKQFASVFASDAKEQLATAKKEWNYENELTFKLQPLLQMHLSKDYKASNGLKESGNMLFSYFLSGISLFILIIACINFVNLAIGRSVQRSKEIGVRKAIGSTRKQLILQFLSESFILISLAFIFGLLLVFISLPTFNDLASKQLALSYLFDLKLILVFVLIFILTGLLAGFYPALVLSGFKPVETLYGRFNLGGKNMLQKSLIVFQFALASIFIIFSIVQYRQANLFTSKDLGYDDKNLIEVNADGLNPSNFNVVENELLKNPSIVSVAPINRGDWMTMASTADGTELGPKMKITNPNLLNTMGLKVLQGRFFSNAFPADSTKSALVNESFVKKGNLKNPIGQQIKIMNRDNYEIIGIVKDYHHSSLYETISPQVFLANPKHGWGSLLIRITDGNVQGTLDHIRKTMRSQFPTFPYSYSFVSDVNKQNYEKEFKMRQIILFSALIIIFISCIGMFGLATLTAQKRTKEISIRKIMGASITRIAAMMSMQFLKLVVLAFIIATPFSYFIINISLKNLPYRIDVTPDIYIYTFGCSIILAIVTSAYQAIKAALVNPVQSLKAE
jgi:putative ABC transport system permease protein